MQLLVISNGKRRTVPTAALLPGKQGNLQTLAELLPMIRRDAEDEELRNFTLSLIADCPNEFDCRVGKVFEYARDSIRYVSDPLDAERIADAATTRAVGWGDCGDKSELLSAMLGTIGYLSKLRALNFFDDLASHGYDHLLVRVQRDDGVWLSLDPTPERARPGWEPEAPVVHDFDIWPVDQSAGGSRQEAGQIAGVFDQLIAQGIQLGTQFAAGAMQRSRVSHEQEAQIGAQFDRAAGQVTALFNQIQSQPVITREMLEAAIAGYQGLAQLAQQYANVDYVVHQWESEDYRPAYEERLRQMAQMAEQSLGTNQGGQSPGILDSVLPASVSSMFSNPLAIVAVGLMGVALVFRRQ